MIQPFFHGSISSVQQFNIPIATKKGDTSTNITDTEFNDNGTVNNGAFYPTLTGTAARDVIDTLAGNDIIEGLEGNNSLISGSGNDSIAAEGGMELGTM